MLETSSIRAGATTPSSDSSVTNIQLAQAAEPIGGIREIAGNVGLFRADGTPVVAEVGTPIYLDDSVVTGSEAAVEITFIDGMTFSLGGNGRVTIDTLIYNPGGDGNGMSLDVAKGAFVFVTGQLASEQGEGVRIDTPANALGIRGTSGACDDEPPTTVWTCALLPDPVTNHVGRIVITNPFGVQVLDQAFESTQSSATTPPTQPVILTPAQVTQLFRDALRVLQEQFPALAPQRGELEEPDAEGLEEISPAAGPEGEEVPIEFGEVPATPEALAEVYGPEALGEVVVGLLMAQLGGETEQTAPAGALSGEDGEGEPSSGNPTAMISTPTETFDPAAVEAPPSFSPAPDQNQVVEDDAPGPASGDVLANDGPPGETRQVVQVEGSAENVGQPVQGEFGILTLNADGSYIYALDNTDPDVQALGEGESAGDNFTYLASNGSTSSSATLTITIVGANDQPVAVNDGGFVAPHNAPLQLGAASLLANDTDIDGDPLTISSVGQPSNGTVVLNGDGSITYTPNPGFSGTDSFSYTTSDGNGGTSTGTVSLNVAANEPPSQPVDADEAQNTVAEGAAAGTVIGITALSTDPDPGDTVAYSLTDDAGGRFQIDASTGVVTVASGPLLDFETATTHQITVQASDGTLTSSQTFTITVTNVNEAPTTVADTDTTTEDAELTAAAPGVLGNDADPDSGDGKTVVAVNGNAASVGTPITMASGALLTLNADGSYSYDPNGAFEGLAAGASTTDGFTYTIEDSGGLSSTATVTITINGVNDAPVITSGGGAPTAAVSVAENATAVTTVTATDVDGPSPTFSIAGGADAALFTIDANTGVLNFVSAPNFEAPADANGDNVYEVQVQVADGQGGVDLQTITVTVQNDPTDDNQAPVAVDDAEAVSEDTPPNPIASNVLSNDFDLDEDPLTVSAVNGSAANVGVALAGQFGTLTLNADGGYSYTLDDADPDVQALGVGETATDSFGYTVADGQGGTATATLTITINGTNDGPVITSPAAASVVENTTAVTTVVAGDVDGDPLSFSIVGGADVALFTIDANSGVLNFVSAPDFEAPADANGDNVYEVQVQVADGALTDTQTISVTVTDVVENQAPVADPDKTVTVSEDSGATGLGIAAPTDANGDALTITVTAVPNVAIGSVYLADGETLVQVGDVLTSVQLVGLIFMPAPNASGAAGTFAYTVSDGSLSDGQTVTITVEAVADPPLLTAASAAGSEDTAIPLNISAGLADTDGSETLALVVSAIPVGATLSDGINSFTATVGNTSVDIASWTLPAVTITPPLNSDADFTLTVTATASEVGNGSVATASDTINVVVNTVDDAPTIPIDSDAALNTVLENAAGGTLVGLTAFATDPDGDEIVYSLTDDAGGRFEIDPVTGVVRVKSGAVLDYEVQNSFNVTVQALAGLLVSTQNFTIELSNVDEGPSAPSDVDDSSNTVAENAPPNTVAGIQAQSTDPENDPIAYSLVDDFDGLFAIDAVTGVVTVTDPSLLNFETTPQYTLAVLATSSGGSSSSQFVVNVQDVIAGGTLGDDTLMGTAGADKLQGIGGNDVLIGLGGDDTLEGGDGNDTLTGGGGDDTLEGGAGSDQYIHNTGDGFDTIIQTSGDDASIDAAFLGNGIYDFNWQRIGDDLYIAAAIDNNNDFSDTGYLKIVDQYAPSTDSLNYFEADTAFDNGFWTDQSAVPGGLARVYVPKDWLNGTDQGPYTELLIGTAADETMSGSGGWVDFLFGEGGNDSLIGSDVTVDRLFGGDGNDTLLGFGGRDSFVPGAGNDLVDGGGAERDRIDYQFSDDAVSVDLSLQGVAQFISAGEGFDTLISIEDARGSQFSDTLTGSDGDNFIRGLAGDDLIQGEGGFDFMDGGAGNDTLDGGPIGDGAKASYENDPAGVIVNLSAATIFGVASNTARDGYANTDTLINIDEAGGSAFADTLVGGDGDNVIEGRGGDDVLEGGQGFDELWYGDSSDPVMVDLSSQGIAQFISASQGTDTFNNFEALSGSSHNDTLTGDMNDNFLDGREGDDSISGGAGDDAIRGRAGNDTLEGGAGEDFLDGGDGDDSLVGGLGFDFLVGGAGNDTLDGGDSTGSDQVWYGDAAGPVFVNLTSGNVGDVAAGTASDGDGGIDTLIDVGNINGSFNDDTILGGAADEIIHGLGGDDLLAGGSGFDAVDFFGAQGPVTVDLNIQDGVTGQDIGSGEGIDTLSGFEHVFASFFDDAITGDGNDNFLQGRGGNDTLDGGGGNDFLSGGEGNDSLVGGDGGDNLFSGAGDDTLDGGADTDTAVFAGILEDYQITNIAGLITITDNNLLDGDDGTDTLMNIEELRFADQIVFVIDGSAASESLEGGDAAEFMRGFAGNDTLNGNGGNDTLVGGLDDDTLVGGGGADQYQHAVGDAFDTILSADGIDTVVITTANLYDLNYFRDGDDLVVAGAIDGNYDINDTGALTIKDHYLGASIAYVQIDTLSYNLDYGTDPDIATFYFTTDIVNGGDHADATEVLLGTEFGDIINGNGGFYDAIYGNGGNDTIDGGDGFDHIRGGAGDDSILGGLGDDVLRGDSGNDTLDGGDGIDRARYDGASGGVIVDVAAGTATDIDGTGDSGSDTLIDIEDVRGSDFADSLTGDGNANRLEGRGGADTLAGGAGEDDLRGGGGSDSLLGGADRDRLRGDFGNDTLDGGDDRDQVRYDTSTAGVTVNLTTGLAQDGLGDGLGGTDTLISIERVVGSSHDDTLIGHVDIFANLLGSDGADSIDGAGNGFASYFDSPDPVNANLATGLASDGWGDTDTLVNLIGLSGSDHNDTLTGDGGDNWFEGRMGNDTIDGGAGDDVVNYNDSDAPVVVDLGLGTASDGVGGIDTLISIEDIWASELGDSLTGNASDNLLFGSAGNDTLTGGGGADTFDFSLAVSSGADLITDFTKATDKLSFFDVIDADNDLDLDLDDLNAAIANVLDNGAGSSVVVSFDNGATLTFNAAGTGTVNSIVDLVDDPATQILIT